MSAPRVAIADLKANIVLDGASSSPPWWAMLRKCLSSQGLGSGATAPALDVPTAGSTASDERDQCAPELHGQGSYYAARLRRRRYQLARRPGLGALRTLVRMAPSERIVIRGAREHNLKDIDLELPRNALIVITGLSGSGKSSLAFDTIYAEGQRRYVESLSAYARQFLGLMEKPDVDSIEGLSPAISIDQKTTSRNPRSTVGTVTEIYDYLRLLWARIGSPHCPECGEPIEGQSVEQITDRVMTLDEGTRFMVMAPVVRGRKGEFEKLLEQFRLEGYSRVRVDGELRRLDEEIKLDKKYKHDISVVVDRLVMKTDLRRRLSESIEAAAGLAGGVVEIDVLKGAKRADRPRTRRSRTRAPRRAGKLPADVAERHTFTERFACLNCGTSIPELEPRIFSFNSPHGACERCHGLGFQRVVDPELVVPDPTLSLAEGALQPWRTGPLPLLEAAGRGGRRARRHRRRHALAGARATRSARSSSTAPASERHKVSYTQPLRPPALLQRPLRGHRQQPRAPLRGDRLGRGPRAGRGLHGRAALPRLRGRPAAAREPRGQGRRDLDHRVLASSRRGRRWSGSRSWS